MLKKYFRGGRVNLTAEISDRETAEKVELLSKHLVSMYSHFRYSNLNLPLTTAGVHSSEAL